MKPLSSKLDKYRKDGCMPISSSCVVWNGPDIPCINLCKGDTIDEVVYQLATILCDITENVLDVTTLDFECLLVDGQCPPETLLETLQLLISSVCTPPEPVDPVDPSPLPNVDLPECLWYTNGEGDTVTALPIDEYVEYLASQICQIIVDITSINAVITSLNTRVTILETAIGGGGGGGGVVTNITTKCLSGSAPGQTLPITTAFSNLEQKLCDYIDLLGSLTEWQAMFDNICIDSSTALPCGTGTYGDLVGWIDDPVTVAGAVNNLWLAVCKINDCIKVTPELPCVLLPATSPTLSNVTTTSARVNWVAPLTPSSQPPTGYKIEVFTVGGTTPIVTLNVGPTPLNAQLVSPSITAGTRYVVKVYAIYECGTSLPVEVIGQLKNEVVVAKFHYDNQVSLTRPEVCNLGGSSALPFNYIERTITITLKDGSGNPIVNSGAPIETRIRLITNGCGTGSPSTTNTIVITIGTGFNSGSTTYTAQDAEFCADPVFFDCNMINTTVQCWEGTTYAGGAPIPTTIGFDTSLTSLGACSTGGSGATPP